MATLEELYRYYLNQPITYVPGSTIGGLSSLTEINRNDAGGDSMEESPVTSINTDPNVTNTTPGTGIMGTNINFSDIGKAIGFAMNPALGIANLVATQVFGKSPMDMAMEAMGIGGFGRTDSDFATAGVFGGDDSSSTGTANATDTGDMGSEAANDAASASAAAGGSGGGGADSAGDGGDGYAAGGRIGYAEGSSNLSREEIINRILQEIKPGFESAREVYPDYYSTGLDVDYLKTLDPDEIKQALDRAYLQGEGFQNADFTSGRIGQGSPFFRYSPEYMKKVNYNNPLQISNSNTAYNLRNQLNELESILGKKNIEAYKTTLDDSLIDYYKNRFTADLDLQKKLFGEQTTPTVAEQMISPDDAMNQYDISNQVDEVTGVGSGALTAGSLLPKYIDDFQYAAPPGTDIDQVRNLARQTASDKSITALIKDVYNDPAKFDPNFKPKAGQIKTGYPQYLKEGILSATGFQPTSQIGGGTDAARAFLEKIKSVPGAQFLGKVLPGVGTASGVYDVGSRLSQGDYVGAGLGALSAIPFVGIPAAAAQAAYDYRGPLIEKATNFFNKLQSAPSNVTEHINTAVGSLNPFQQQQYVNYAIQNPDQAITAAQQNKDFLAATQKNIAPATTPAPAPASMAAGGRVFYLQGGLASLLR
jgi:hypothetical protein